MNLVHACHECNNRKDEFIPQDAFYYPYSCPPLFDALKVNNVIIRQDGLYSQFAICDTTYEEYISQLNLEQKLLDITQEVISRSIITLQDKFRSEDVEFSQLAYEVKDHASIIMDRRYIIETIEKVNFDSNEFKDYIDDMLSNN